MAARAAGVWAVVLGAGAEYCTYKTKFVFPGTPKDFVVIAGYVGHATHLAIFLAGLVLLSGYFPSFGLLKCMMATLKKKKPSAAPAAGASAPPAASAASSSVPTPAPVAAAATVGSKKR